MHARRSLEWSPARTSAYPTGYGLGAGQGVQTLARANLPARRRSFARQECWKITREVAHVYNHLVAGPVVVDDVCPADHGRRHQAVVPGRSPHSLPAERITPNPSGPETSRRPGAGAHGTLEGRYRHPLWFGDPRWRQLSDVVLRRWHVRCDRHRWPVGIGRAGGERIAYDATDSDAAGSVVRPVVFAELGGRAESRPARTPLFSARPPGTSRASSIQQPALRAEMPGRRRLAERRNATESSLLSQSAYRTFENAL